MAEKLTEREVAAEFGRIASTTAREGIRPDVADLLARHADEAAQTRLWPSSPYEPTSTQPVPQPDPSLWGHIPKWALGVGCAAPAAGLGSVGLGFGANLFFSGVTTEGVVVCGVLVTGAVAAVGALSGLVKNLGKAAAQAPAPVTNHMHGPVEVNETTHVHNESRALSFQRNRIK